MHADYLRVHLSILIYYLAYVFLAVVRNKYKNVLQNMRVYKYYCGKNLAKHTCSAASHHNPMRGSFFYKWQIIYGLAFSDHKKYVIWVRIKC